MRDIAIHVFGTLLFFRFSHNSASTSPQAAPQPRQCPGNVRFFNSHAEKHVQRPSYFRVLPTPPYFLPRRERLPVFQNP